MVLEQQENEVKHLHASEPIVQGTWGSGREELEEEAEAEAEDVQEEDQEDEVEADN